MSGDRSSRPSPGRVAATLALWTITLIVALPAFLWVVGVYVMNTIVSKNLPHE